MIDHKRIIVCVSFGNSKGDETKAGTFSAYFMASSPGRRTSLPQCWSFSWGSLISVCCFLFVFLRHFAECVFVV